MNLSPSNLGANSSSLFMPLLDPDPIILFFPDEEEAKP